MKVLLPFFKPAVFFEKVFDPCFGGKNLNMNLILAGDTATLTGQIICLPQLTVRVSCLSPCAGGLG